MGEKNDLDITKSIRQLESLKCELLSGTSDLFKAMIGGRTAEEEREEALVKIIMCAYILSGRLNINYEDLDKKIGEKLRLMVLNSDELFYSDCSRLLKYLEK